MGLQVPQGVVGGLVVTRVSLGGWTVLQQHQRHRKDDVPKVKVLVQDLQIRSFKGHTNKVIQRSNLHQQIHVYEKSRQIVHDLQIRSHK